MKTEEEETYVDDTTGEELATDQTRESQKRRGRDVPSEGAL